MIRFQRGKSYLWLWGVLVLAMCLAVACAEYIGHFEWSFAVLPLFLLYVVCCEIRSTIALDSWFHATHVKDGSVYSRMILWHILGTCFLTCIALVAIAT